MQREWDTDQRKTGLDAKRCAQQKVRTFMHGEIVNAVTDGTGKELTQRFRIRLGDASPTQLTYLVKTF